MDTRFHTIGVVTIATAAAASHAAFETFSYESAADPASYGSLVSSLDVASTSYDFPIDTSPVLGFTNSGFKAEILDPGTGLPVAPDFAANPNTAQVRTDVYEVTSPTVVSDGGDDLTLDPGDLVFAYRIQHVGDAGDNNTNVVDTVVEFGITSGLFAGGSNEFDSSIVKGRGFSVAGLSNLPSGLPIPQAGDFDILPGFFSSLDWRWDEGVAASQLQNAEEITLLVYTKPALIENGEGKLVGVTGQASSNTDPNANNIPVLVPAVPSPGAVGLAALGLAIAAPRRRR